MIDQKTLNELKNELLDEKSRLEDNLKKIATKEDGDYEAKFDDIGRSQEENAEEVDEYSTNLGITETLEKNLRDVEDALGKMEGGTYGICENCGKEISIERLRANPSARTCIKC
jgi:DnaK suppressor protein